jgi:lactoylglutathione lyase
MKFSYTILYVKDVSQAVVFYEQAFGLKRRFTDESGQYAEMETDATTLAFAANDLAKSNLPQGFQANSRSSQPAGIEVGFVTENVDAFFENAVKAGADIVVPPKIKPWGQTVAYVRDLDGILVSINSSMSS